MISVFLLVLSSTLSFKRAFIYSQKRRWTDLNVLLGKTITHSYSRVLITI
jgi:hypothetical protein